MADYNVLVVLYNKPCEESSTCRALRALPPDTVRVLLYDNSTRDCGCRAFCQAAGWDYLGGEGNMGLSRAYNECVDKLLGEGATGYLCLFDDDTEVTQEYFAALDRSAAKAPRAILVPVIFSGGNVLSPCRIDSALRTARFADENSLRSAPVAALSAINSCMAIPLSVFKGYRYDEHIFLDGVDHRFVQDMKARGVPLHIIDYSCRHAFSGDEKPEKQAALNRFALYAADYAYILRGKPLARLRLVVFRALKLCAVYRTPAFLKHIKLSAKE